MKSVEHIIRNVILFDPLAVREYEELAALGVLSILREPLETTLQNSGYCVYDKIRVLS